MIDPGRYFRVNKVDIRAQVDMLDKLDIFVFVDMVYNVDTDPPEPN